MSVLQEMTAAAGIMTRKAGKAAKLTPVAGETTLTVAAMAAALPIPEVPEVFLTNEAVADIAKDLRTQAATLISVADGLDKLTATKTAPPIDTAAREQAEQREAEKAADERAAAQFEAAQALQEAETPVEIEDAQQKFEAAFAAKSEAVQAATYADLDDTAAGHALLETPAQAARVQEAVTVARPTGGWTCPTHGATVHQLTSRKGRVYMACTQCDKFEK
jgi:hypothetical protein